MSHRSAHRLLSRELYMYHHEFLMFYILWCLWPEETSSLINCLSHLHETCSIWQFCSWMELYYMFMETVCCTSESDVLWLRIYDSYLSMHHLTGGAESRSWIVRILTSSVSVNMSWCSCYVGFGWCHVYLAIFVSAYIVWPLTYSLLKGPIFKIK